VRVLADESHLICSENWVVDLGSEHRVRWFVPYLSPPAVLPSNVSLGNAWGPGTYVVPFTNNTSQPTSFGRVQTGSSKLNTIHKAVVETW
jgi:hypothetical protein